MKLKPDHCCFCPVLCIVSKINYSTKNLKRLQPDHWCFVHSSGADDEVFFELLQIVQRVPRPKVRVQVDVAVAVRVLESF
jgi:hypothetical protein